MAAIHTLFNLITTALFLPFVKPFARLVARIIRTDAATKPHLSALKMTSLQTLSKGLHDLVRASRQGQLNRIGPDDPNSPIRVLVELDILNAYERVRAYYLNIAETLAGGKGN